jgi:hypothetical protein
MTATRHVTLWCDVPGCPVWFDNGDPTTKGTRQIARREGWHHTDEGGDICPKKHNPKEES